MSTIVPGTQEQSEPSLLNTSGTQSVVVVTEGLPLDEANLALFRITVYAFALVVVYMSFGLVGNTVVLYTFQFRRKLRKTTVYILALTFVDLFSCVFNMPVEVALLFNPIKFDNNLICKISRFTSWITTTSTTFLLVAIAIDRYILVCRPFQSRALGVSYAKRACAVAVILGISTSWPALFIYGTFVFQFHISGQENIRIEARTCLLTNYYTENQEIPFAFYMFMVVGHIVIFIIFIVLYILIGRRIFMSIYATMPGGRNTSLRAIRRSVFSAITGHIPHQCREDIRLDCESRPSIVSNDAHAHKNGSDVSFAVEKSPAAPTEGSEKSSPFPKPRMVKSLSLNLSPFVKPVSKGDTHVQSPDEAKTYDELIKYKIKVARRSLDLETISPSLHSPRSNRNSTELLKMLRVKSFSLKMNTIIMRMVAIRFSVCFLPYLVIVICRLARKDIPESLSADGKIVYHVFLRSYFLISMINPYIYLIMSGDLKAKFKQVFSKCIWCK